MSFPDPIPIPKSGALERLTPLVRRLVAPNASPLTSTGTCTYIVGAGDVVVVDPGPDDPIHFRNLLAATESERVCAIFVTHSHRDHVGLVAKLKGTSDSEVLGAATPQGREGGVDSGDERSYAPDRELSDGRSIKVAGLDMTVIATPGHAPNHLCFAFENEGTLFSGDHVMAWSTTIIAPPEGNMADYLASLEKLRQRTETMYWPGHGGAVADPQRYVGALLKHRLQRESAIFARIKAGVDTLDAVAEAVYPGLDSKLRGAARLSTLAHIEHLASKGEALVLGDLRDGGRVVVV